MALTEDKRPGAFILAEAPNTISRDTVTVTVAATTTLSPGQVLGKITATGKFVPYDNGATPASDGSQNAAGILYGELVNADSSPADMDGVIVNWTAEVRKADLVWGTGMDEDAGLADLAALGIKGRD
jgi:hypothetical protein